MRAPPPSRRRPGEPPRRTPPQRGRGKLSNDFPILSSQSSVGIEQCLTVGASGCNPGLGDRPIDRPPITSIATYPQPKRQEITADLGPSAPCPGSSRTLRPAALSAAAETGAT